MANHDKPCPKCGHCPTCGRSNQWNPAYPWGYYPWRPYPVYTQPILTINSQQSSMSPAQSWQNVPSNTASAN